MTQFVNDHFVIQTLTGYKYLNDECPPTVKWIMFHDDDALINLEKAIKFFEGPMAKEMNCFGFLGENSRPHRWGKYNVTELQWESGRFQSGSNSLLDCFGGHSSLFQVTISLNFVPGLVMVCHVNLLRRFLKLPNKLKLMDFDLKMFYFWESFEKKQKWKFHISKRFAHSSQ